MALEKKAKRSPSLEKPVRIATAEVTLVVDEQVVDAAVVEALDTAVLIAPAERDIEVAQVLHAVLVLLGDGVVLRNEHDDLGARGFEGLGQGARHVAEAAGLHEGRGFGAGKCDMEFLLGGFGHMDANLLMRALLRGVEFSDSVRIRRLSRVLERRIYHMRAWCARARRLRVRP